MSLETVVVAAGSVPSGDGWKCVHSWANWEGRWWLYQRFVSHHQWCGQDGRGGCTCNPTVEEVS